MGNSLYAVCAVCGYLFGHHRASDSSCPVCDPDEQIFDEQREWADTKFKNDDTNQATK